MAAPWKVRLIRKFLDFVPGQKKKAPILDLSNVPNVKGMEDAMYDVIEKKTNESGCIPKYEFVNTSGNLDAITDTKPDGILLKQGFKDTKLVEDSVTSEKLNYMRYADIIFEMKPCDNQDGSNDVANDDDTGKNEPETREHDTQHGVDTRGQLIEYVTDIMSLQHRHCAYTVSFIGTIARIARWDRSGAVVSTAFDYADTKRNYLGEFLWRYVHASPTEQGFDDTVTEASSTDAQTFVTTVREYLDRMFVKESPHRKMLEDTLDSRWPTCKMTVTDEKTQRETHYIIRRPFSEVLSPCGSSTRAYLAYALDLKKVVFLKDSWRLEDDGIPSETEAYDTLRELGIPHLPNVLASGDVKSGGQIQHTLTDQIPGLLDDDDNDGGDDDSGYAATKRAKCSTMMFSRHIHHRVVQDVALPISFARSSKELVQAIRNVIETIWRAHRDGHLLHRDISTGNVMLNERFEGMLNDWDHSVWVPSKHASQNHRTGTWAFMSIELLDTTPKPHALLDDIESCYWVLLFLALRYFEVLPGRIQAENNLFDEFEVISDGDDGRTILVGGRKKWLHIIKGRYEDMCWSSKPLTRVIHEFGALLTDYHHAILSPHLTRGTDKQRALQEVIVGEARKRLEDVEDVIKIFDDALSSKDWPDNDISIGNPEVRTDGQRKERLATERHSRSTPSGAIRLSHPAPGVPTLPTASSLRESGAERIGIARNLSRHCGSKTTPDSQVSTGQKRTLPGDLQEDEHMAGPSENLVRSKRVKKGKEVDRKPMTRPRTRNQDRSAAPPPRRSARATRSRIDLAEGPLPADAVAGRRGSHSATRNNQQAAEMPPLRRSTRLQSRAVAGNPDNSRPTMPLPRRVTRLSSRNANVRHEDLTVAVQGPKTRARRSSAKRG